jgi:serine/threonine-protein kinase
MPNTGESIGPYTLTSKLGQGGFGAVWLAERRTSITTTRVALKTPLDGDIDLESIRHEADLWVQASGHPNVVPIIEADVYDGQVVIVSEYAPGGTLAEQLSKLQSNPMPVDAAAEMTLGILAGLEHLHLKQIIHRDLKPANILLQGETPRLTDFGISRVLKNTSQSSNIAGTPVYMAPEAFDGKRSAQTDVWSVGVIFYELLTGSLPYPQTDLASLVGAILRHDPGPLPRSVPPVMQQVVNRALQKDPQNRFKSAGEMRQALKAALQIIQSGNLAADTPTEISITPPPPTSPTTVSPQPVKHGIAPQYVYAGAAVLIVLFIGGGIALLTFLQRESTSSNPASVQRTEPGAPASATPTVTQNQPAATEAPRTVASFQSIESRILSGSPLSKADIAGFSKYELKLLRNTVYARHGRLFQTPELQNHFDGRPWYIRRNNYNLADLTSHDHANVKLIQKAENE